MTSAVRTKLVALTPLLLASCSTPTDSGAIPFEGELSPLGASTVEGSVAAVTEVDRTQASIAIRRALPGVRYTWSLHRGDCSARGELLGGVAVYPELDVGEDGMADAHGVVPRRFVRGVAYAAWVDRDDDTGSVAVACGRLEEI